jgi:hypothetical protein
MAKPIQKPKVHHLRTIYTDFANKLLADHPDWWGKFDKQLRLRNATIYAKENNKVVEKMSWRRWKETVERYFHKAKTAIIEGETLNLGSNVGKIRAIRVERNFANPVINWGETFKQKIPGKDGKYQRIYHTEDDYCRIQWAKTRSLPNETSYSFDPAAKNMATGKGFKAEFVHALKNDPLLKFRYRYYPLIKKTKPCNTPTLHSEMSSEM